MENDPIWKMMDEYINAFKRKFGHVNCKQLTYLNLKTSEKLKEYSEKVHDYDCAERVKFAIRKVIEILASF